MQGYQEQILISELIHKKMQSFAKFLTKKNIKKIVFYACLILFTVPHHIPENMTSYSPKMNTRMSTFLTSALLQTSAFGFACKPRSQ